VITFDLIRPPKGIRWIPDYYTSKKSKRLKRCSCLPEEELEDLTEEQIRRGWKLICLSHNRAIFPPFLIKIHRTCKKMGASMRPYIRRHIPATPTPVS
jgi:hypothetical protein